MDTIINQRLEKDEKEEEMKIKISPNIAVRHQDYAEAVEFYSNVLGFKNRSNGSKIG